jgi:hypothetical protein
MSVPGFLQYRRRLARDRRFIDIGDTLDDLAIRRHHVVLVDAHDIADPQLGRRDRLLASVIAHANADEVRAGPAQGLRLRLAATLSQSLGVVCKPDRQGQNDCHNAVIEVRRIRRAKQAGIDRQGEGH